MDPGTDRQNQIADIVEPLENSFIEGLLLLLFILWVKFKQIQSATKCIPCRSPFAHCKKNKNKTSRTESGQQMRSGDLVSELSF